MKKTLGKNSLALLVECKKILLILCEQLQERKRADSLHILKERNTTIQATSTPQSILARGQSETESADLQGVNERSSEYTLMKTSDGMIYSITLIETTVAISQKNLSSATCSVVVQMITHTTTQEWITTSEICKNTLKYKTFIYGQIEWKIWFWIFYCLESPWSEQWFSHSSSCLSWLFIFDYRKDGNNTKCTIRIYWFFWLPNRNHSWVRLGESYDLKERMHWKFRSKNDWNLSRFWGEKRANQNTQKGKEETQISYYQATSRSNS